MSKTTQLVIDDVQSSLLPDDEIARCAINEEGVLIYANAAFFNHINSAKIAPQPIENIFTIINNEGSMATLQDGEHEVQLKNKTNTETFYFNWLTTSTNKRYLIAAKLGKNELPKLSETNTQTQNVTSTLENLSHDITLVTETNGNIISTNHTFLKSLNFEKQEIQSCTLFDLIPEHDILQTILSPNQHNTPDTFISTLLSKEQNTHTIQWNHVYINNRHYFSGRDITNIKQQKDNLKRRERQLSEAEAIGRMGHWRWFIEEDTITWSEEIFRIFGLKQDQFNPTIHALTEHVHKRDIGRVVQIFQRAIIEEQNYDMEFRIIQPDGNVRFVSCEGRCEKDQEGEVIALYGIIQDMTERVLYEQNLKQAKDASEQAYAAKSRFLANMSHELRTPLNAIIGFSEMIESEMLGPLFNDKYIEYATSIRESGHHLLDLINDILDMSKIEAGKHTLDIEEVNLKDILEYVNNMIQGRANEENISLSTNDLKQCDVTIAGDRRALIQIFLNLLSNAIKFTPANGSVSIECDQFDEYLTIKVCDTGIGIPANKLAAVLKPFEQASSEYTRDYEGTGLGLSITKELIQLHSGNLGIESKVDIGTTVTVRLPYTQE